MTLQSLNKKLSIASIFLLTATALAGPALAFADITGTGTGQIIINAEEAAPTKDSSGNTTNASGTTNDGTDQSGLDTSGTSGGPNTNTAPAGSGTAGTNATGTTYGMANVAFSITSIQPKSGATSGSMKASDSTTYDSGPNGSTTATTDSTGVAKVTGLPDGFYLVHETTTVGGITPIADFIVQVKNGNTTYVYPKLSLTTANGITGTEVNKDTNPINGAAIPVKNGDTNANWSPNNETTTAAEGKEVDMVLTPTFDPSMTTDTGAVGSYVITETITKGLTPDASKVTIAGLTEGTDFTATPTTNSDGSTTVTITLTSTGITDAAKLTSDGDGTASGNQLTVTVPITVDTDFVGTATSKYTTTVTNAYGTVLDNDDSSNTTTETVNVGGGQITKEDDTTKLPGASFTIVAAASAADAIAVAGGDTTKGSIVDTNVSSHTTGSDGVTTFEGLSLPDGTTGDGTATEDKTTYWAVETAAPAGYQIPAGTAKATQLDVSTTASPLADTDIQNNQSLNLPFTGGQGLAIVLVLAGAVGGTAFLVTRKRRSTEEEASN